MSRQNSFLCRQMLKDKFNFHQHKLPKAIVFKKLYCKTFQFKIFLFFGGSLSFSTQQVSEKSETKKVSTDPHNEGAFSSKAENYDKPSTKQHRKEQKTK